MKKFTGKYWVLWDIIVPVMIGIFVTIITPFNIIDSPIQLILVLIPICIVWGILESIFRKN